MTHFICSTTQNIIHFDRLSFFQGVYYHFFRISKINSHQSNNNLLCLHLKQLTKNKKLSKEVMFFNMLIKF